MQIFTIWEWWIHFENVPIKNFALDVFQIDNDCTIQSLLIGNTYNTKFLHKLIQIGKKKKEKHNKKYKQKYNNHDV